MKSKTAQKKRNEKIYQLWKADRKNTLVLLGKKFGITKQRVHQIVRREGKLDKKGENVAI